MKLLNNYISSLSETKRKIFLNVFWALLGKVVNMLGILLVGILIARYLGPEQFGLMNYVISYVTLFSVLAGFGLENIEIRELSREPERKNSILGTAFLIRLFFAMVAVIAIGITLCIFRPDTETTILIAIYSLTVFTGCFNVIRNYFTSIVKNEYVVKSEIARTLIGAAIKIALLWFGFPLIYFIIALVLDPVLVASGYVIAYNRKVGKIGEWRYERKMVSYLVKESFPLLLSGAAMIVYQRIDQVMIGNMIDDQSVGYFAAAARFTDVILVLPLILVQTVTPILVRIKKEDPARYEEKKLQFISIVVWGAVIISLLISVTAYWLIACTYGVKYMAAIPVLQIIAWKTVGMALSASSGQIIIMEGLQKWDFVRNILACAICVGLNLLLIPVYGVVGSAWVTIITILFTSYLSNIFIPAYHRIMRTQSKALLWGWKEIYHIKDFIK